MIAQSLEEQSPEELETKRRAKPGSRPLATPASISLSILAMPTTICDIKVSWSNGSMFSDCHGVQAGGVMWVRICAINRLSALECYPSNTTHVWAGTFEDKHQNGTDFPLLASNRVRRLKGPGG